MGRFLSGGAGSSGSGVGGLITASTPYVAGEAVQQGQLANLGADGLAYYSLDPLGPGGALRPLAGLMSTVFPYAAGPAIPVGAVGSIVGGCVLAGGNAVVFTAQFGVLQFGIYNQLGVLQGQMVTVANNVSPQVFMNVVALTGGGFAFAYTNTVGSPGQPTVAVYNAAGAVVQAPTLVEAGVVASAMSIAALSNGGFAVAYNATGDGSCRYAVYSGTGAAVKAGTNTTMGGMALNSPCGVSVASLADGGFVVVGLSMNGTTAYSLFSRYNAAGVAQQTNVTANTAGTSNVIGTVSVVGFTGGGFVVASYCGPSSATYVTTFTAAGAAVGAMYVASSYGNLNYPGCALAARPGGDAVLVSPLSAASAQMTICKVNGTMGAQASHSQLGSCNELTILSNGHIAVAGTGPNLAVFDSNLALVGSVPLVSLGLTAGTLNQTPACILGMGASPVNPAVPLALTCSSAAGVIPKLASIATVVQGTQKTTPVGVFGASAAAGSAVPVQFMGLATLSTGFVQPFVIDANGTSPPGQRMSVVGNQAILNGIQATARRQIN